MTGLSSSIKKTSSTMVLLNYIKCSSSLCLPSSISKMEYWFFKISPKLCLPFWQPNDCSLILSAGSRRVLSWSLWDGTQERLWPQTAFITLDKSAISLCLCLDTCGHASCFYTFGSSFPWCSAFTLWKGSACVLWSTVDSQPLGNTVVSR